MTAARRRRRVGAAGIAMVGLLGSLGAAALVGGGVVAQSGGAGSGPVTDWRLAWSDEFNGSSLDTTKWGTCFPADRWTPDNCTIDGGYVPENREPGTSEGSKLEVTGGVLRLWAEQKPQVSSVTGATYAYRTAMVQARRAMSAPNANVNVWETSPITDESAWTHIYMEARIRIPYGVGLWPTFWLMPADGRQGAWPYSGELDVLEFLPDSLTQGPTGDAKIVQNLVWHGERRGSDCTYQGNYYFTMCPNRVGTAGPTPWTAFHTFGVEKSPSGIGFFIDGQMVRFVARWPNVVKDNGDTDTYPFDQPFFPILRLSVGGPPNYLAPVTSGWPVQSPVPSAYMDVDYVRVYQRLGTWGGGGGATVPSTRVGAPASGAGGTPTRVGAPVAVGNAGTGGAPQAANPDANAVPGQLPARKPAS